MNFIKQALRVLKKRSDYRSYLKYYRSLHQSQSERYQQISEMLEHLRVHGASQSAVLSRDLREGLLRLLGQTRSVNQFYQSAIETELQSIGWFSLKPIALWEGYLVLHDQENMNQFLRAQYLKIDSGIRQLSLYYGYGIDARILGAHFIGYLKRLCGNLERNHQGHQRTLRFFQYWLVTEIGVHKASPEQSSLFKKHLPKRSGSEQFLALMAHCNRPAYSATQS